MTANRSSEELEMRAGIESWGRSRLPSARVMHELPVGGCRIDLAFVTPTHLLGVEIKSSKDTLDRLDRQIRHFTGGLPEVWLAVAERWVPEILKPTDGGGYRLPWNVGQLIVAGAIVRERIPFGNGYEAAHPAKVDLTLTAPLLHLLHHAELLDLGDAHGLKPKRRMTCTLLISMLARALTGDEIVHGVCERLRARPTGWQADAPVHFERATGVPAPHQLGLV